MYRKRQIGKLCKLHNTAFTCVWTSIFASVRHYETHVGARGAERKRAKYIRNSAR